ncbi:MAG: hypothetical protein EP329_05535 [Deltaproteobacteria bacterium]|nr:MAG: hypothetical protein EP329_05535 [Deltaproteobacteria bacterium]
MRAVALATLLVVASAAASCQTAESRRGPYDQEIVVPGPRVSHSRGESGGIVLLWPRVYPSDLTQEMRPEATALQRRLLALIERELPGRPVDVRPEPERVCPADGCLGTSVGVLLVRVKGGCAAVLQVGRPGREPTKLEVWAGVMSIALQVPFREPPESYVKVRDFVPCGELVTRSSAREASVVRAIQDAF